MISKKNASRIAFRALYILILAIVTVTILYPLFFVVMTSFKSYLEYVRNPFAITFRHISNYAVAWKEGNFGRYFFNSVIVTASIIVCQILLSAIASFAIGRLRFRGANVILSLLLCTMFFTGEMTSIPTFILVRKLGMYNSMRALIFVGALGPVGLGAFLGTNYLRSLPKELTEAAVIDGASIADVFFRIDLPLMKSPLIMTAIMSFNGVWSDYMWPRIVIPTNQAEWTLPLGLVRFYSENNAQFGVLCAGLCIITLPILIFYCFFSKYFIEGASAGAVKG